MGSILIVPATVAFSGIVSLTIARLNTENFDARIPMHMTVKMPTSFAVFVATHPTMDYGLEWQFLN